MLPAERTDEIALVGDNRYVRLVREKFAASGNVHFHIELIMTGHGQPVPAQTATVQELQDKVEVLLGKTLFVNFMSRFVIAATDLPSVSLVQILSGMGMKFNNTPAKLSAANVRLDDSVFSEVRWSQIGRKGKAHPDHVVELHGRLGLMPVTPDLLTIVIGRANEGLHRFVMPPRPADED